MEVNIYFCNFQAFPSMALINVMKLNVAIFFPLAIEKIAETKISIKRIEVNDERNCNFCIEETLALC